MARQKILPVVREQLRVAEGRNPEPSAGVIDSQSVKGADTVGRETRGYDAGKKVSGRKRFITTDTLGLLLCVVVCSAGVQDRDGAKSVLLDTSLRTRVRFLFAVGGFAGRLLDWAHTILATTLHIVRKPAGQQGFAVIPRRWAVERTFAWLTAHRRLARDYERHPATSEAMIHWLRSTPSPAASPVEAPPPASNAVNSPLLLIFSDTLSVSLIRVTPLFLQSPST